ncbi:SH3 domain-containing protein [Xanthobacter sp. KR7-225]|uniref:SH3 domain-containing protein n=1 Tax=Xanthobacter sp. KR7-225 TaxID=3156613 RepID=UPI0032B56283
MSGLQRAQRRIAPRVLSGTSPARANAGSRPRAAVARPQRARVEGVTLPALWRLLAIAACAGILGGGALLGVQLSSAPSVPAAPDDHRRLAVKVASILGAPPAPERPRAEAPPTAEDFARPAFLEPLPAPGAATATRALAAAARPADEAPRQTPDPQASEGDARVTAIEAPALPPAPLPPPQPAAGAGARTARIAFDVTMRSGPRRGAAAIGQIDRNTRVTVIACKSWCEVVSGGKRGFVYRRAVDQRS